MAEPSLDAILQVRTRAERVATRAEVESAVDRMALRITDRLAAENPVLLGLMIGGIVPLGMLSTRLQFPLQIDYVHASRYAGATAGGVLNWMRRPPAGVRDRVVLLVDDVLDHGFTLQGTVRACLELGAREVLTAVLVKKRVARRAFELETDFFAVETDDRYLFGYGMDYQTYLRNADGIYAVKEE